MSVLEYLQSRRNILVDTVIQVENIINKPTMPINMSRDYFIQRNVFLQIELQAVANELERIEREQD